jgi:hypothetical protein
MSPPAALFVAVANGKYIALPELTRAVKDAEELAHHLEAHHQFHPVVLRDYRHAELIEAIDEHLGPGTSPNGLLIVAWTSHGRVGPDRELRLMGVGKDRDVEVAQARQLGEWAARTRARQVLVLIDSCYAGSGVLSATAMAKAVSDGRASPGKSWFAVLAASRSDTKARSGAMADAVMSVLTNGPREPDIRWDRTRPYIRGDDLLRAFYDELEASEPRQEPDVAQSGPAGDLVRNPFYVAGVPDQPIEHLLLAARGSSGDESFFTGREQTLAKIVTWMRLHNPGLFVVVGPPGSGKSAVIGRIVSLSSSSERPRLLPVPAELDPGPGSVHVQLHAHGITVDVAIEKIARQLGLDPATGVWGILAEARRSRLAKRPLVIAIDGLDEARAFSADLAVELVTPLAKEALVLMGTRDVAAGEGTLVDLLAPVKAVVDLGQDPAATRRDVHAYVTRRLDGVSTQMDPARVAEELAPPADGAAANAPFLLARLVTSQLRERPVDTAVDGWKLALASTVENALERDLQSVTLTVGGRPHPTAARELVSALTFAHGGGFPVDDVWPAVATAISRTQTVYTRDDAFAVLGALARHLVAGTEGEQPVYRLAHRRLIDYLRADASLNTSGPSEQQAKLEAIGKAVFDTYAELLDAGVAPRGHTYLWRYAWRHLAEAGSRGLADLERLAERDQKAFLPDMAAALKLAADEAFAGGAPVEALALQERAVLVCRDLAQPIGLALALFSLAHFRSSTGDGSGAEDAAREASVLAREARDDPEARAVLALALTARAMTQLREGRYRTAKLLAQEAVTLAELEHADNASEGWESLAQTCELAARAEILMSELDSAEILLRRALDLIDANEGGDETSAILVDVLSSFAVLDFLLATRMVISGDVRSRAFTHFGDRLLAAHDRGNSTKVWARIAMARGLSNLVRARWLDNALGLSAHEPSRLEAILDDSINLVREYVDQFPDAGLLLAISLLFRGAIRSERNPARSQQDIADAESILRRLARVSDMAAVVLGEMIDQRVGNQATRVFAGDTADIDRTIEQQQEAVALLRRSEDAGSRRLLAGGLGRLALLLVFAGRLKQDVAARAEAIKIWRELEAVDAPARIQLVGNLVDQVARLQNSRPVEALELARESVAIADEIAASAATNLAGIADVNLARVQLRLRIHDNTRLLVERAIERLTPWIGEQVFANALAFAYLTLAELEHADQPRSALANAERSIEIFDGSGVALGNAGGYIEARLTLGQIQRSVGEIELGTTTLRRVLDEIRAGLLSGQNGADYLASALNANPDLWDEMLASLGERPDLVRQLDILRERPAAAAPLTIRTILDHMIHAPAGTSGRLLHEIARFHRRGNSAEFDAAWLAEVGPVPHWMLLDDTHLHMVIAWWNAPTWRLSRDYLASHPELLGPATDIVLDEFRLGGEPSGVVDRHVELIAMARAQSIEAAYAPLLADVDAEEWMEARDLQEHLLQHVELRRAEVVAALRRAADRGKAQAAVCAAILELTLRGEQALAFDAAADPGKFLDHLRAAVRSTDASRLAALSTIVLHTARGAAVRVVAAAAFDVACVLDKSGIDRASALVTTVAGAASDDIARAVQLVDDAVAHHPGAAAELGAVGATLRVTIGLRNGTPGPRDPG